MDNLIAEAQAREAARVVYEFDLPAELQELGDKWVKKTLGFVKLRMEEEKECYAGANGIATNAAFELTRRSLVEVDGKRLNKGELEDLTIMNNTDPLIRDLMTEAYATIANNTQKNKDAFLKSRRVKVTG